jgi:hypothetical protein
MQSLRTSPVFALAVVITLGLVGLNGVMILLMQVQPGFLGMAHFTELSHRSHDLTFGFLFVPAVVGMLAQLRAPSRNIAGQLMALMPWGGLVLTSALTFVLANTTSFAWIGPALGPATATLIAAILHPAGRAFFRSFSVSRVNWVLLALVCLAAGPLLVFASTNIRLQGTVSDSHSVMGHYGFMAAFSFTVIGVGLLASLRPDGWWLPAWVTGLLPALLGFASLVYPGISSSLSLVWALAAMAWGVVFVAVAELTQDAENPTWLGSRGIVPTLPGPQDVTAKDATGVGPGAEQPLATSLWVKVLGIIVLILVLLFIGLSLAGVGPHPGPRLHTAI